MGCCQLLTSQDASTDGHIASEGALLVNVGTCTTAVHMMMQSDPCIRAHLLRDPPRS